MRVVNTVFHPEAAQADGLWESRVTVMIHSGSRGSNIRLKGYIFVTICIARVNTKFIKTHYRRQESMQQKLFPENTTRHPHLDSKPGSTASLILAAGKGSRMAGYDGCKPLLPLVPSGIPFEGGRPMLLHIITNLPPGPVAVVVHHRRNQVIRATSGLSLTYCDQTVLNGTGGALLAARDFLERNTASRIIITMGDVPLVTRRTYSDLARELDNYHMVVLAFAPADKKRYGLLEMEGKLVRRIVEWEYWRHFSRSHRDELSLCNSGIYAVRGSTLHRYLPVMQSQPHRVVKHREGTEVTVEEYFITDLVEYLNRDGLPVGCIEAADEQEVMGVDDPDALETAQKLYSERFPDYA